MITLENVFLKVYASFIRNQIFEYLKANDYIECRMQKGFIPKISGTIEHTHQLVYIIRQAKSKQKTLVVTLLDLKNAFGQVSHSLIPTVLQFHHIPQEMQNIISELYSGFSTSIANKTFVTPPGGISLISWHATGSKHIIDFCAPFSSVIQPRRVKGSHYLWLC